MGTAELGSISGSRALPILMSARSDPATPLATPREVGPPSSSPAPKRLRELQLSSPLSDSTMPRQPTPPGTGSMVEIGGGWTQCTPGDGGRKKDAKRFDLPVLKTEPLDKQLLHAVGEGDAQLVDTLLKSGANVDAADPTGTTPTMVAAASGDAACLQALLSHKPNLTATNSQGRTALHVAAFLGRIGAGTDPGCIGLLMRAGADPTAPVVGSDGGATPMQLACIGLLGDGDSPRCPSSPRGATTPRRGSRVRLPKTPTIKKADVELLLSAGPVRMKTSGRTSPCPA